jgi:hypothetical protein
VPADEDEGAGGDEHYVTVEQDPDQSLEGCLSACADEGKSRFNIHLCFTLKVSHVLCWITMWIYVQELNGNLDALSLSTFGLFLLAYGYASCYAIRIQYKSSDVRHSWE